MQKTKSYEIIFKITTRHKKKIYAASREHAWKVAQNLENFYIETAKVIEHLKEIESVEEE